jgi:Flp pilus assembly protein TadD
VVTGSFQIQSLVKSDYQLSRTTKEYEQSLLKRPTDQLALMGLGINFFYMNDFEKAREKVVAALKLQK